MKYKVAILTVSDSCSKGEREDLSGKAISKIMTEHGFEINNQDIVPDTAIAIQSALRKYVYVGVDLVITTGGTGFSPKDITPEATKTVIEKEAPGIAEALRANGMQYSDRSMLSRGICGIARKTIILNLPGSPKAVIEGLEFIISPLRHALDILVGKDSNCARTD